MSTPQTPIIPTLPPDSIIIDWESCSLEPDAALLSFGALAFNRHQMHSVTQNANDPRWCINVNIDLTTQFINGFHFDQSTAEWWRTKNMQNIEGLYVDRKELIDLMTMLNALIGHVKTNCRDIAFFCRHTHADYTWLKTVCQKLSIRNPIMYNRIFDVSSFIFSRTDELKGYIELPGQSKTEFHHAFNDCFRDAMQIATVVEGKRLDA